MIRSELRTLTAALCEDPNQVKFTAVKYNDALDKANAQFAMDSKALYKDSSITVVVGTAAYSLPTDFMLEKEVVFNGIELKPISTASIQKIKISDRWDDDSGTPFHYIVNPEEGKKTITLYPKPDSIVGGSSLVLTYYCFPAVMTTDADIPLNASSLMAQFHTGLAAYAAWLLMFYLPQTAEISQKRSELFNTYKSKIDEAIQTFGNTKSESMSFHVGDVRSR